MGLWKLEMLQTLLILLFLKTLLHVLLQAFNLLPKLILSFFANVLFAFRTQIFRGFTLAFQNCFLAIILPLSYLYYYIWERVSFYSIELGHFFYFIELAFTAYHKTHSLSAQFSDL